MVTDPISDFMIRLKNGSSAKKQTVLVTYSRLVENIAHALKKSGYISSVEKSGKDMNKSLEIGLVYIGDEPRIHEVERISKSSRRIYQKHGDIRMYKSGFGNTFFSTTKGIMADVDAKKHKVGGEVLFKIW